MSLKIKFSQLAEDAFYSLEPGLKQFFASHLEKLQAMPPRRHLRFGLPFCVEEVTRQARLVYAIEGDTLFVIRCFATHKEYEKWFKSYK